MPLASATPITSAAMSRSRIAAHDLPTLVLMRFFAIKANPTTKTNTKKYVLDRPLISSMCTHGSQLIGVSHHHSGPSLVNETTGSISRQRANSSLGHGRPVVGPPATLPRFRHRNSPMNTRPSVTNARYRPRTRTAVGAMRIPTKAAPTPAAGSHTQMGSPRPHTVRPASPPRTTAVYAPTAMKNE